jgi:hypothetical protein
MTYIGRAIRLCVLAIAASIVLAAAGLALTAAWARHVQHRAEACLADFLRLEVGKSTFADLVVLQRKYGGVVFTDRWKECTPQHCAYQFNFQNTWFHRIRLAPRIVLGLTVGVEDDHITSRLMYYGEDPVDTPATEATHITETYTIVSETVPEEWPARLVAPFQGNDDFKFSIHLDSRGHPFHQSIFMTTNVSSDDRMRAYSVDLSCLSRIGECDRGRVLDTIDIPIAR